jgi:short chain dehydrogenase
MTTTKVALVTGASSGIGEATARQLAAAGFTVYAAARRTERLQKLTAAGIRPSRWTSPTTPRYKPASRPSSPRRAASTSWSTTPATAPTAPWKTCRWKRPAPRWRSTSSAPPASPSSSCPPCAPSAPGRSSTSPPWAARSPPPSAPGTTPPSSPSKPSATACAWKSPLRHQRRRHRAGGIRTEWSGIAADKVRAVSSHGPYAPQGNAVANSLTSETTRRRSSPPELIGKTITKAVTTRHPRTRYAVGYGAKPMIVLHGLLPDRTFDAFIRRATSVPST